MATEQVARRLRVRGVWRAAGLLAVGMLTVFGQDSTVQIHAQSETLPGWQKAAEGKMEFEVASIRPAKPGTFTPPSFALDNGDTYSFGDPPGRFFTDFPLSVYIEFAYKQWLTPEQVTAMFANLPKWIATDSFVIDAPAPGNPTKDQMRLMLQSLLADRFKLAVHFETQQAPAFALVLEKPGKMGPKLRPHSEGPACDVALQMPPQGSPASIPEVFPPACGTYMLMPAPNGTALLGSRDTTMQPMADSFPFLGNLGRPVVDETGLSGEFDFTLNFARESNGVAPPGADGQPDSQGPTFLEALREQLGLKLNPTKAMLKVLV
ncbi:MAG: TIGR03435 family protein, partial [Terracidiphilus sp.]